MTRIQSASSVPSSAAPRPGAGGPQRGKPATAATIDPIRVLRQHAKLLVGATVVGLVLGTGAHFLALNFYPLWGSTVLFEIKPELTTAKEVVTREILQDEAISRLGQTESAKIMSKSVLEAAMSAPDIASTKWGQKFDTVPERVAQLQDELKVGHRRGTQLFTLSWRSFDKNDVPTVLNRVADTYMAQREDEMNVLASQNRSRAEERKRLIDGSILQLKNEIQDFIRKSGISAGDERDLPENRTTEALARERDNSIRELTLAQSRLDSIDRRIAEQRFEDEDRRRALDDFVTRQIERDVQQLQMAVNSARERFSDDHPQVKDLGQRMRAAEDRFKVALTEAMSRNLLADKTELSQRVTGLKSLVAKQSQDLAEAQRKLQELTAQISALDSLKEQLAQKEIERKDNQEFLTQLDLIAARPESRRVGLVQKATTPKELDFPQLKFMVPGGALLMLVIVAGIVFLREFLDQRVKQPSDLAGVGGVRLMGVIPDLSDDPADVKNAELVVRHHPLSVTAEMFRQAAASLRKAFDAGTFRTVAFVSAHPEGGTTTTVSNLAASAQAAGRTVAVVDANFRRPRLAAVFGVDPDAPGLGDMLMGKPVEPQMANGIAVFGAGTPDSRVYERLSGDEVRRTLAALRERYQVVLLDLPPTLVAGESIVITDSCDAVVLVVRALKDQRGLVAKTINQLHDTKATLLGTILMRPEHTVGGYFKKNAELMADYAKTDGAKA